MTIESKRATIVRLAAAAGLGHFLPAEQGLPATWWGTDLDALEYFFDGAVAAEREACAQHLQACNTAITDKLAAEIRARGAAPRCCEGGPQWGHSWDCPETQG